MAHERSPREWFVNGSRQRLRGGRRGRRTSRIRLDSDQCISLAEARTTTTWSATRRHATPAAARRELGEGYAIGEDARETSPECFAGLNKMRGQGGVFHAETPRRGARHPRRRETETQSVSPPTTNFTKSTNQAAFLAMPESRPSGQEAPTSARSIAILFRVIRVIRGSPSYSLSRK